ncbi:CAMK CAMKL GIN4 kinase [Fusarium albosuccineum]|uniref:non-specific serine/threonine protein kinase n=1 Tax=Fusarium albosuccineum TaxID=1237068 RepID=A0A8H4PHS2_9HYPO|nr:CAMK CAMKL GIN4 kinase [Fusarium albosuccineum]
MAETMVSTVRSPLSEASNRINSAYPAQDSHRCKSRYDQSHAPDANGTAPRANHGHSAAYFSGRPPPAHAQPTAQATHTPAALRPPQEMDDQRRHSAASYDSSGSGRSKNYKTRIGPWRLGKTLGKGSSARVRLCRHEVTEHYAAVKIVNRRMAYLVQDSSLAALSKWDNSLPDQIEGEMRVPMAIEREVAILKLIEHPNIMKLYDIWENRSEVYLILEFIDQGDLFTFINTKGRLSEEVSVYFFRQMISAISYCHSFNICHRDLKPENILITHDLQIKIADFGMAALHQTDTHQLATACGSPHYAAPELLKNRQYRGDKADIWSMGVILYAMLSATLPFDDPDIRVMMARTKKGQYEMPSFLSPEAEDLIKRMLQVNPDRRIALKDIWRHPLIQKYADRDNLEDLNGQPPDTRKGFQYTPVPAKDVDSQLLRQLRSMWHMFSENDLKLKLTCDEPNDQKAFYWLLYNYREKQLEDFKPELTHSMSDYHHMKPGVWKKRVSTCEFAQPRGNGHGRSISRFTVISNAAEPESRASCEPLQEGRVLHSRGSQTSQSKASTRRNSQTASGSYASQPARLRSGSGARRGRMSSVRNSTTGRLQSSRGSVSSLHSSRQGTPHARSLRHKRGVDFTHVRKRSTSTNRTTSGSVPPYVTEQGSTYQLEMVRSHTPEVPSLPSGILPKPTHKSEAQFESQSDPESVLQPTLSSRYASEIFKEELRHFSSNIAKDCDEAFRSSLIEEDSIAGSLTEPDRTQHESTPFSFTIEAPGDSITEVDEASKSFSSRPLPPLPSPMEEYDGSSLTPTPIGSRPTTGDSHFEELRAEQVKVAQPVVLTRHAERRVVSAPVYNQKHIKATALPSINETGAPNDKARIVSAPPHTPTKNGGSRDRGIEYLSRVENSIRVVHSPSNQSPVKIPEPLNVRKKTPEIEQGQSMRPSHGHKPELVAQRTSEGEGPVTANMAPSSQDAQVAMKKKKSSWFKRSSKVEPDPCRESVEWQDCNSYSTTSDGKRSDSASTAAPTKKKTFSFTFWKSNKQRDSVMSIAKPDDKERPSMEVLVATKTNNQVKASQPKWHESDSEPIRNIEVKQNWLARLFRVKPATSHLCMTISRKRARQEVAILLREWRKHGIRNIQVDKQRNIVFARVAAKNSLDLKEVSFAAEMMTVIEHGKKQPLSIIRFTQERGAASSFHRVVDIMGWVFQARGLLVADRSKQKMMIKTLNS